MRLLGIAATALLRAAAQPAWAWLRSEPDGVASCVGISLPQSVKGFGRRLLFVALLITPCVAWAEGEWPQRLPDGQPSRFDWPSTSLYWRETRNEQGFLFLHPEGFIWANIWKNGKISYFLAHWKTVAEISSAKGRSQLLMSVDQFYCGGSFTEHHPSFRLIEINYNPEHPLLTLDVATGVSPPASPLGIGQGELWEMFEAEARYSNYKDEGPFRPSSRDDMPQWFLDLIVATWDKGRFDCGYTPSTPSTQTIK